MTGSEACVRTSWPFADVMLIELNRPQRHNALDAEMVSRLTAAFNEPGARAVILTSSHADTFCSGADLSVSNDERVVVSERLYGLYETMVRLPIPIIAAIGGHAIGGGAQLAIACDLRIASPHASFRFLGVGHGLVVGAWALPRLVGAGRAFELCATMRPVAADEAARVGLVNLVADDPAAAAMQLAAQLVEFDAGALARIKEVIAIDDRLDALSHERTGNQATWDGRPP
jgi:enoyl-CoA hydratase/carnithine racemase